MIPGPEVEEHYELVGFVAFDRDGHVITAEKSIIRFPMRSDVFVLGIPPGGSLYVGVTE